ncbi:alpha/beta hydrolase [Sphaerospermopsis aphanizomenoides BCCUSP55]|uniref:alpha/beta hydrolase n=1 Tax=Sphaerospermopsis aphanizomenoides TaxID=459663 RepID=UPI0019079EA0|nr:alpha/beta hydrolase [Sphaerospermopsis aphanizomenoides]MBK1988987.1 alpha/beta hydrolase [Sphaerospermopsis aphanizomenoides BCCUSP55]
MLILFIHGVAESKVKFAEPLKKLIQTEFSQRGQKLPHFHSGFYADILNNKGKVWNFIHQDLQKFQQENPYVESQYILRGKDLREGFISDFVGDAFTYLNFQIGKKIRQSITEHLEDFITNHSQEKELHIIAHSMGTVILWDMLFSDNFENNDPAFKFRELINDQVQLKSITTMGSPVILFNMLLDIPTEQVKLKCQSFKYPLRWLNIIHSSDMIAYPISSSLEVRKNYNIRVTDKFIVDNANNLEILVRQIANYPGIKDITSINKLLDLGAIATGAADAHIGYWNCPQTAKMITENILGNEEKIINLVIKRLEKVPGMTTVSHNLTESIGKNILETKNIFNILNPINTVTEDFTFIDGSGRLRLRDNLAQVPHVTVYDPTYKCQFRGYVGLIHADGLREEIKYLKQRYGKKLN